MKDSLTHRIYERLNKPEYWFQPRQVLCRLRMMTDRSPHDGMIQIRVPWGVSLDIRAHETIGKCLRAYGVYELSVSEVLWRLTDPGDWCVDVGANIGYMTGLLSVKSGATGRVFCFEPHPAVFARLDANVRQGLGKAGEHGHAPVILRQQAIGAVTGEMDLVEPVGFHENEGTASLAFSPSAAVGEMVRHRVEVRQLDSVIAAAEHIGVMKIDVEGAELSVLQGAKLLLKERRIRDIVFEDFQPFPSHCVTLLQAAGYVVRRIGKGILGPLAWNPSNGASAQHALPWEPVNYLATLDLRRVEVRLRPRGWRCLSAKR